MVRRRAGDRLRFAGTHLLGPVVGRAADAGGRSRSWVRNWPGPPRGVRAPPHEPRSTRRRTPGDADLGPGGHEFLQVGPDLSIAIGTAFGAIARQQRIPPFPDHPDVAEQGDGISAARRIDPVIEPDHLGHMMQLGRIPPACARRTSSVECPSQLGTRGKYRGAVDTPAQCMDRVLVLSLGVET